MSGLSRRKFLHLFGVAGLTPLLPALPTMGAASAAGSAASAGTISASAASKALWSSLYANAGSSAEFVKVTKSMGLSSKAIQGVGARTLGVRLSVAPTMEKVLETGGDAIARRSGSQPDKVSEKLAQAAEHLGPSDNDDVPHDEEVDGDDVDTENSGVI